MSKSNLSDWLLISQVVLFDNHKAFGKLIDRYQSDVKRFLFNLSNDIHLSEDLTQETFIRAYLKLKDFRGNARLKTWLFQIAYRQYLDYIKVMRNIRHEQISDINNDVDEEYSALNTSSDSIDFNLLLTHLKDDERMVMLLFYMEDVPIKSIAKIMNAPEGTIKSLLSRSKVKLKNVLKNEIEQYNR